MKTTLTSRISSFLITERQLGASSGDFAASSDADDGLVPHHLIILHEVIGMDLVHPESIVSMLTSPLC